MRKKIVIRCITDETKGFGNFTRCYTLAKSLQKYGYKIIFIINNNKTVINKLQKRKFNHFIIPKNFTYSTEWNFIDDIMNSVNSHVLIIDMREYAESISKKLFSKNYKTILIDDAFCQKAYADIIFNGTLSKQFHNYKIVNKKSKLYLGPKYFLANEEFKKSKKSIKNICKKKKYNVLISMGGSDPANLTLNILKSLINLSDIQITVIIGPFFKNTQKIIELSNKNNIILKFSPDKIWKEFEKADVVISKSGVTLYELVLLKIPTICIIAFKHEAQNAQFFMNKGCIINLGMYNILKKDQLPKTLKRLLDNPEKRKQLCIRSGKVMDGKGLNRTSQIISKIYDNYK
jgi:UDP-2,4-diacetamido-2,4,6-trideoxy-beta-L-altropyranose hydrolase